MSIERRTATELLDQEATLLLHQVAIVLNLRHTRGKAKGDPDIRAALALVTGGHLRPVNPALAPGRLTVSTAEVRRYLGHDQSSTPLTIVKDIA